MRVQRCLVEMYLPVMEGETNEEAIAEVVDDLVRIHHAHVLMVGTNGDEFTVAVGAYPPGDFSE